MLKCKLKRFWRIITAPPLYYLSKEKDRMSTNSQAVIDFRKRRKENLVKLMGGKCCLCGYNRCIASLQFHHINPEEKEYGLAANGNCHKIEDDIKEAKKCILICSNCHGEIHNSDIYNDINLYDYQCIDTDFEAELLNTNLHASRFCSNCNKPISMYSRSGMCPSCVQLGRRRIVENRPNREELKNLIRTIPFTKIAEQYGCTDNAVRKWCDKEGLPRKKADIEAYSNEEWELI